MMSVNRTMLQVKIVELWKALNNVDGAVKIEVHELNQASRVTRLTSSGNPIEKGKDNLSLASCVNDSTRAWNKLPNSIKESTSVNVLKKRLRTYVKSIPI